MENKDIDYFCIIEVIKVINKHHIKYTEDFLKNYPKPVHLKKKTSRRYYYWSSK